MDSSSDLTLRPVTDEDTPFLYELFCEVHKSDYETLSLPADQLATILEMQFQAQRSDYSFRHPEAIHEIIEFQGAAAGQWMWAEGSDHVTFIDISMSMKFRNQGIASQTAKKLLRYSALKGLPVIGHVARNNPKAIALWRRLGFQTVGSNQTHLAIEFKSEHPSDPAPPES